MRRKVSGAGGQSVLGQVCAGGLEQRVERGALLPHGVADSARVADLGAPQLRHGVDEGLEPPGIEARKLVDRPQGRRGPSQLPQRCGGVPVSGLCKRGGPGVARAREVGGRDRVDLFERLGRDPSHGSSLPCARIAG
jgi:hypothetical protein